MIKGLLTRELRVWHLLLVVVLLLASTSGVLGAPVAHDTSRPAALDSYLAAGQFRMAAASSTDSQTVHSVDGWVEVLRASFTIPSGQKAGVAAFFNAEAYKYANGYCYARFELENGTVFNPRDPDLQSAGQWVADGYVFKPGYPTISIQGFQLSIPAGTHSVIVKLLATGGDCFVDDRSLILIANQH
jgi:hypothetical protein